MPVKDARAQDLKATLAELNLDILEALAAAGLELELAYELGRSLRDTANPPEGAKDTEGLQDAAGAQGRHSPADTLAKQLAHGRISKLQEWLATLSSQFPQHAAAIVAASIGRWSELAAITVSPSGKPRLRRSGNGGKDVAQEMRDYLHPQGDMWLMLLVGTRSTAGLVSPEGYVAAGEAALRRSARITRRVLRHYWVVLSVLAVALAATLYLAATYLGGAAKVWTSIVAISGALGISAQGIASALGRMSAEAERPVFGLEEEDAMAWAVTTLPRLDLTSRGVRQLRKAGVAPPANLGEV